MGEDTSDSFLPLIVNLTNLLWDTYDQLKELKVQDKRFILDGGLRFTTFGNASGGNFPGDYRFLIFEDKKNNADIVSISQLAKGKFSNHPIYGNTSGHTILCFAIDNYEVSHLSLEYAIDRFVKVDGSCYTFEHDGTLTVGKKGRVKNLEVIDFILEKSPHLINENKIYLGEVNSSFPFTWSNPDVLQLFSNFIEYAFLRDEFRKFKKNQEAKI